MKRLNNNGDTIVEVLIAMAVMASILGGAFVSARRSSNAIRASQERVEALAIAQGQIELARTSTTPITSSPICYRVDGIEELSDTNMCKVNYLYEPIVMRTSNAPNLTDITATVSWDGVGGIGRQTVELVYRKVSP